MADGGHQQADCSVETAPLRVMLAGPRHVVNKDATGQLLPPIWWAPLKTGACKTFRSRIITRSQNNRSQNCYLKMWNPKSVTLGSQINTQPRYHAAGSTESGECDAEFARCPICGLAPRRAAAPVARRLLLARRGAILQPPSTYREGGKMIMRCGSAQYSTPPLSNPNKNYTTL